MAFRVWAFVKAGMRLGAAMPNDARMGTTKNKTISTPKTVDIRMNGDFCFSQPNFSYPLFSVSSEGALWFLSNHRLETCRERLEVIGERRIENRMICRFEIVLSLSIQQECNKCLCQVDVRSVFRYC